MEKECSKFVINHKKVKEKGEFKIQYKRVPILTSGETNDER